MAVLFDNQGGKPMKFEKMLACLCLGVMTALAVRIVAKSVDAAKTATPALAELPVTQEQDMSPPAEDRAIKMKVTAYCPCSVCCGSWSAYRRTSIGDDAAVCDGVAADPKLIPYRTKLWIPGVGEREVDDTGGAMRQSARKGVHHIDVRFKTHDEARRFGVEWLEVKLLETTRD